MSKTKHTPGPWHISTNTHAMRIISNHCVALAEVYARESVEKQVANAHLIAAAPEMLEALERITEMWQESPCSSYPKGTLAFIQDIIEPLIRKAKGE